MMFHAITGSPTKHKRPGGNSGALAGLLKPRADCSRLTSKRQYNERSTNISQDMQ